MTKKNYLKINRSYFINTALIGEASPFFIFRGKPMKMYLPGFIEESSRPSTIGMLLLKRME